MKKIIVGYSHGSFMRIVSGEDGEFGGVLIFSSVEEAMRHPKIIALKQGNHFIYYFEEIAGETV
jgi:hypothetical protein